MNQNLDIKYQNILVIKHGALGDLMTATGAFSLIRRNFPRSHITLITDPKFLDLTQKMGYFDEFIPDDRPKNPFSILKFAQSLRKKRYSFVFDLQNSPRTSLYYRLMGPFQRPFWSGIAPGASHPQTHPDREFMHAAPRFADQLEKAGLDLFGQKELLPDLCWMKADLARLIKKKNIDQGSSFALLIPGSSLSGAYKRWSAHSYVEIANFLRTKNVQPVLIAGPEDHDPAEILRKGVPGLIDLTLSASLFEIAELARRAKLVIGNDTGPTLISAGAGALTYILWSGASDPKVYAPKGKDVHVLFEEDLKNLSVERVCKALSQTL